MQVFRDQFLKFRIFKILNFHPCVCITTLGCLIIERFIFFAIFGGIRLLQGYCKAHNYISCSYD